MRRYPGLSPFSSDQQDIFFGRQKDIKELAKLIFVERKILLYSKSGYGKTSLLNAGVIPELEKNKDFEFIKIRFYASRLDGADPVKIFLDTVLQHPIFRKSISSASNLNPLLERFSDNFWTVFKRNQILNKNKKTYILVFDQFEELFSYSADQILNFKIRLAEIIQPGILPPFFNEIEDEIFLNNIEISEEETEILYKPIKIKAVFSMRSDRLSSLNQLTPEINDIQKIFYELNPLNISQAREAIVKPSTHPGEFASMQFVFDDTALVKILNSLTSGKGQIELTQLQILCHRIEETVIKKNEPNLVVSADDIPDFKDVFLTFYNTSLQKIPIGERDNVRRFVEDFLIVDSMRIALDEKICKQYVNQEILQILVDSRLLRMEKNSVDNYSYELSHDSLIEPIGIAAQKRKVHEKEQKRRRKLLIAVSILIIIMIVLSSLSYTFYRLYSNSIENDRKFRQSQYYKQLSIGDLFKAQMDYDQAISEYTRARDFDARRNDHENRIEMCKKLKVQINIYNELKLKADSLYILGDLIQAADYYVQADSVNEFHPDYTKQKILSIARELKQKSKNALNKGTIDQFTIEYLEKSRKLNPDDVETLKLIEKIN